MKDFDSLFSERLEGGPGEETRQNEAFEALCRDFVQPNEEPFRRNYGENCPLKAAVGYEECALDFIPIADKEYFVLDKQARRLCGTVSVKPYEEDERTEKTFTSILIADYGDIREIMPIIRQKRWRNVYILLNGALSKFASFFKLEGFSTVLPANVKFFAGTEDMRRYFLENPSAYLPRKVFSPEPERYDAVIEDIHNARVRSGVPSQDALLSVCIPSFNRGHRALQAVHHALATDYDAEIEIVLVNTGSTVRTEGYQQIKDMTDSRLRYYELEKNGGYPVSYCSALRRGSGHFAMMLSDEDLLAVENLDAILEYLWQHQTLGATTFDVVMEEEDEGLVYLVREPEICEKGMDGLKWAFNWTRHISGTCFNYKYMKTSGIFEKAERYLENYFFITYTQCVFTALIANEYAVSNSGIAGWYYGESEFKPSMINWEGAHVFFPKSRIKQERDVMEILGDMLCGHDLDKMFDYQVNATFDIMSLSYKNKTICPPDKLASMYCWSSLWREHYENCLQILRDIGDKFEDISAVKAKLNKSFLYWQICKREQRRHTAEENLLPSLQAQVVKFYHEKGVPFEEIDFDGIEQDLEGWVKNFLAERS